MKRIGVMAATAMIALLLALPLGLAMAQDGNSGNVPPATLFGTAMADGFAVPPGTMIVAMVGDEKIGSTEVMADGKFGPLTLMAPSGDDMMVSFMVGERMSDYMYDWMSGGAEAMVMVNADLVPDDSTMEGMTGPAGPPWSLPVPMVLVALWAPRALWVPRERRAPRARRASPVSLALTAPTERRALPVPPVKLAPLVLLDRWGSSR